MSKPAAGTALRFQIVRTRFEPDSTSGPKPDAKLTHRIAEVRRLLRTDLSIEDIAARLSVCGPTLRSFIKRRSLCDVAERKRFIHRQKTLARSA